MLKRTERFWSMDASSPQARFFYMEGHGRGLVQLVSSIGHFLALFAQRLHVCTRVITAQAWVKSG
ncbi:hypothetical protein D7Y44_10670 [Stenotrophomonas maltophilia]|nr:hypothetical protein [Stenotrophomonas maltophilia]MBA0344795.1 hypothetical protein [Stenotrophomonas maltophilia]MBA0357897.1 hypothetical protein [Stenotrophomonas maltophilia]MBA0519926.1 hypothetical protein [Stenotrophomonas maltophilia]